MVLIWELREPKVIRSSYRRRVRGVVATAFLHMGRSGGDAMGVRGADANSSWNGVVSVMFLRGGC
jgi:hypothetical protein